MNWKSLRLGAACAAAIPLMMSSCAAPVSPGGYVGTDPASWSATHNMMPGAPKKLSIRGEVTVAAANYNVAVNPRSSAGSPPEYDLTVTQSGDIGAQVITRRKVSRDDPYSGMDRNVILRFPDGKCLKVPISRPN